MTGAALTHATPGPEIRSSGISWFCHTLLLSGFLPKRFMSHGEPLEDLIQVGTMGLINAIRAV